MNHFGSPETGAEGITRLIGVGLALAGALELYGLYFMSNPTHWLSNIGLSIGDGSFRTLSMFGVGAVIIGAGLYFRKGLNIIIAGAITTLVIIGHGKWYTLGGKAVQSNVTQIANPTSAISNNGYINTGVALTTTQLASCNDDDDRDGILNRNETKGWQLNCSTGFIHKVSR